MVITLLGYSLYVEYVVYAVAAERSRTTEVMSYLVLSMVEVGRFYVGRGQRGYASVHSSRDVLPEGSPFTWSFVWKSKLHYVPAILFVEPSMLEFNNGNNFGYFEYYLYTRH